MPRGFFSQVALIILSIMIIATYVKPKMDAIKSLQDSILIYKQEEQKVTDVNQKLAQFKSKIDNISDDDRHRLLAYMPNSVDTIAVPRDIEAITQKQGAILKSVKFIGVLKDPIGVAGKGTNTLDTPDAQQFSVTVVGSYSQLKGVFNSFEQNAYPLEVQEVHIVQQEGGFLQADIKMTVYSRRLPVAGEQTPNQGNQPQ